MKLAPATRALHAFISIISATVAILIMGLLPVRVYSTPFVFLTCFTTIWSGYSAAFGIPLGTPETP